MIGRLRNILHDVEDRQRISIALAKGGAMMNARHIDLSNPATWEFSGFSQNGEDGILDVLRRQLRTASRSFLEVGSGDGIENNTAWLLVAERYNGVMIDGNRSLVERARRIVVPYSIGAECHALFVTSESARTLKNLALCLDPDVFSLDIDGIDYYVAQVCLDDGFRPKIFVVEYNSVYGPERCLTIENQPDFNFRKAHSTELYYGVSIAGWRRFFDRHGYRFVSVDRNGVNAFFVDPMHFDSSFLDAIQGLGFAENRYQLRKFRKSSEEQFSLLADQKFVSI